MRSFARSSFRLRRVVRAVTVFLLLTVVAEPVMGAEHPRASASLANLNATASESKGPFDGVRSIVEEVPEGYRLLTQSEHLELYMDVQTTQIAIRDLRSSLVWLSSPHLPRPEEVSESLRKWIDSAFYFYLAEPLGTGLRRQDSWSQTTRLAIQLTTWGAKVEYGMERLGVAVSLEYELGPDYLDVIVDDEALMESETNLIATIDLLPLLGATTYETETPVYFVLPDGPGALTYVSGRQPSYRMTFKVPVHGPLDYSFIPPQEPHAPMAVLGIVHPGAAVMALATEMASDASIGAKISGAPKQFSQAYVSLDYRRSIDFLIKQGFFKTLYTKDRVQGDRRVRYFFVAEEEASWAGLAKRLRTHLVESRGLPRLTPSKAQEALRLRLVMGAKRPGLVGQRFIRATTFAQAEEIVERFSQAGMNRLDVVLVGWEAGGYEGKLPKHWPPDRRLGGVRGLKGLAAKIHSLGGRLYLEADYSLAFLGSGGFFPMVDTILQTNLLPLSDVIATTAGAAVPDDLKRNQFLLNPVFAKERYLEPESKRLAELGVDGLELRWSGELVFKDLNPGHPLERSDFGNVWASMLGTVAATMGTAAAQGGNDYVLGAADTIAQLPLYRRDYVACDETVPFFPVAFHGLARLYGEPTNKDSDPTRDFLRRLEYGMLPTYELTHSDPMVLIRTTYPRLYSSQYEDWQDRALTEYRVFVEELGDTVGQFIIGHRALASQVYETMYEDGTTVIVNYGDQPYEAEGKRVSGLDYLITRPT